MEDEEKMKRDKPGWIRRAWGIRHVRAWWLMLKYFGCVCVVFGSMGFLVMALPRGWEEWPELADEIRRGKA